MENNSIEGEYRWGYDEVKTGYYVYYYFPEDGEVERVRSTKEKIKKG